MATVLDLTRVAAGETLVARSFIAVNWVEVAEDPAVAMFTVRFGTEAGGLGPVMQFRTAASLRSLLGALPDLPIWETAGAVPLAEMVDPWTFFPATGE